MITILSRSPEPQYIARMMTHIWVPSPNCALSWVLVHLRIRSRMFGQVRVVRVTHTNSPADRSPARVQRWPSAGTRPWPVRRLGAFAQRGRAHCAYWAMCRQLFGLFRAKRAILSLHAGWRWRAAQSENQLDTGRFAMKGMHSTRH